MHYLLSELLPIFSIHYGGYQCIACFFSCFLYFVLYIRVAISALLAVSAASFIWYTL